MPCWQCSAFPNISFWSVCLKPYNVMLNTYTATSDQISQAMAINHWQKKSLFVFQQSQENQPWQLFSHWLLATEATFPEITWQCWPKCPWPPTAGKCRQSFVQKLLTFLRQLLIATAPADWLAIDCPSVSSSGGNRQQCCFFWPQVCIPGVLSMGPDLCSNVLNNNNNNNWQHYLFLFLLLSARKLLLFSRSSLSVTVGLASNVLCTLPNKVLANRYLYK